MREPRCASRARGTRPSSGSSLLGLVVVLRALRAVLRAARRSTSPSGSRSTRPSSTRSLGTDFLGRDVLSRVLWGGRSVLALAGLGDARSPTPAACDRARRRLHALAARPAAHARRSTSCSPSRALLFLLVLVTGARHERRRARARRRDHPDAARSRASSAPRRSPSRCAASSRRLSRAARARSRSCGARSCRTSSRPIAADIGAPLHALDHPRRVGELPRPRPAAARRRLGADDQREPLRARRSTRTPCSRPALLIALLTIAREPGRRRGRAHAGVVARSCAGARRMSSAPVVVRVEGLRVELRGGQPIVEDVSLDVARGRGARARRRVGVGGKTTTALALLGYARAGSRIAGGTVEVGRRSRSAGEASGRCARLRGRVVSFVPQNPATALNPALRVGDAIADMLRAHTPGKRARRTRAGGARPRRAPRRPRPSRAATRTSSPAASSSA